MWSLRLVQSSSPNCDVPNQTETTSMKLGRVDVRGDATLGMELRFETQDPTSYSGLILFQHFFSLIGIKERLWRCFRHLKANPIYGHHVMVMLLVVHLIIGHRRLRDLDYYRDDELVKRVLGLKRLPDVSTLSRSLGSADEHSVRKESVDDSGRAWWRTFRERTARFDGVGAQYRAPSRRHGSRVDQERIQSNRVVAVKPHPAGPPPTQFRRVCGRL